MIFKYLSGLITSFRYNGVTQPKGSFYMEYELGHYYRVKYALVCTRNSFLKQPPKDDFEEYAKKIIDRAYFIILNKIDELDGTNEKLLKYYKENVEKNIKRDIMYAELINI